jgi:hypothetical protein
MFQHWSAIIIIRQSVTTKDHQSKMPSLVLITLQLFGSFSKVP